MRRLVLGALLLLALALIPGCGDAFKPVSSAEGSSGPEITATEVAQPETSIQASGGETERIRESTAGPIRPGEKRSTDSGVPEAAARKLLEPFVEASRASGGSGNEADSILGVRYGKHASYERMVVDLGAGNRPAESVPEWTLASPRGDGLLRVIFPSISATRTTDGAFESDLLKKYYVVRAPESGMFIDIFVRSGFVYRVIELRDPARLVVDFRATDESLRVPLPAEGGNTVLTEPRRRALIEGPLLVRGYSRNPEAQNTIILRDSDGKVLIHRSVRSNDWTSTWGYFETTVDPPPFSGMATLRVGALSAQDGSFSGMSIPISAG